MLRNGVRLGALLSAGWIACGAAPLPAQDSGAVQALAGRYSEHFANGLVSGETYQSDDVAEVVPVTSAAAYIRLSLQFYNGHSCNISGVAEAQGASLIYREEKPLLPGDAVCTLRVSHTGTALAIDDADGTCKTYCGARGSLTGQTLPWKSRRTITYLERLRASAEYKEAVAAWQKREKK